MPVWHDWTQTYVAREAENFFEIFSSPAAAYFILQLWMGSFPEEEHNKILYILEHVSVIHLLTDVVLALSHEDLVWILIHV